MSIIRNEFNYTYVASYVVEKDPYSLATIYIRFSTHASDVRIYTATYVLATDANQHLISSYNYSSLLYACSNL